MITVDKLKKTYNTKPVLDIPNLDIDTGSSFGLVGNNGAGKTTFFSLLLDLIEPDSGCIKNNDIVVHDGEEWKSFTSSFIDESFLIGYLTPEEYFYFIGEIRGIANADIDSFLTQFAEFFHGEVLNQKKYLRDLSKGNQKKAGIVGALIGQPQVIILDEPFANLDPTTQIRLKDLIKKWTAQRDSTFLISSHDLSHVTEVCERIVVLNQGEIVKDTHTDTTTLKELENYFAGDDHGQNTTDEQEDSLT